MLSFKSSLARALSFYRCKDKDMLNNIKIISKENMYQGVIY